jgi:Proto-chlorophyllide reductase 57 kD subunit
MSDAAEPSRCPYPHGAPAWDEAAREHAERQARGAAGWSHLDPERAVRMAGAVSEARADQQRVAEITELFVRTLGKKLGHGHPLSDRTGIADFTWTPEAEARLREVPEFCRELTRWRVEWTAHKLGLGTTITPEVMQVKYEMWGRVSHAIRDRRADDGLPWTDDALERFDRIPEFVKGQVLEAVEGNARSLGATVIDSDVVDRVIAKWIDTGDFHEGLYGFR